MSELIAALTASGMSTCKFVLACWYCTGGCKAIRQLKHLPVFTKYNILIAITCWTERNMRIRSKVLYHFLFNCMMMYNIILTSFLTLHLSCTTAHFYVSTERCIIPACCVFSANLNQYDSQQLTHMSFINHICDNISIIICLLNTEYVCGLMSFKKITYHMTVTVIGIFPVKLQDE